MGSPCPNQNCRGDLSMMISTTFHHIFMVRINAESSTLLHNLVADLCVICWINHMFTEYIICIYIDRSSFSCRSANAFHLFSVHPQFLDLFSAAHPRHRSRRWCCRGGCRGGRGGGGLQFRSDAIVTKPCCPCTAVHALKWGRYPSEETMWSIYVYLVSG